MAILLTNDSDLIDVADAIRTKTGASGGIIFPNGFISQIENIETGDECNAAAGDILSGKTAVVNGQVITGNISSQAATTHYATASEQTIIASKKYVSGAQKIAAVTTSNLSAGNVKVGVTINVGDAEDVDRIKTVTGTYTSDANATASDIKSGKTAYVNGSKITGTVASSAGGTKTATTSAQTVISANTLVTSDLIIAALSNTNLSAANIKRGTTVTIKSGSNTVWTYSGTCTPCTVDFSNDTAAYMPFMWRGNRSSVHPGWYRSGDVWRVDCSGISGEFKFKVPCNIKLTVYASDSATSTKTITLDAGTEYVCSVVSASAVNIAGQGVYSISTMAINY